jgi:hypothetical protein
MPPSPTDIPSVITVENTDKIILSVMFSVENFFCRASQSVRPSVFRWWLVFFKFLTESPMKWGITDDQYSDGRILSGKMLPTNFMPYTDGIIGKTV